LDLGNNKYIYIYITKLYRTET